MIYHKDRTRYSLGSLVSLMSLYVLIVLLILVFANQIIRDLSVGSPLTNLVVIPLGIILPLFLFVSIGVNVYRLFRDIKNKQPGVKFKVRMIVFFTIVALFASVPQAAVTVNFINSAMSSWFSPNVGKALSGGLNIAINYYQRLYTNLDTYIDSPVVSILARDSLRDPDRFASNIFISNSFIDAVEVFDSNGSRLFARGIDTAFVNTVPLRQHEGLLPREDRQEISVLRSLMIHREDADLVYIVFSSILPSGFSEDAGFLSQTLERQKQYERFYGQFNIIFLLFFAYFSFPLFLLAILTSFILSNEIIRPIEQLEETTRRIASGDFSYRIMGKKNEDLAIMADSFNTMINELEKVRRQKIQEEKLVAWQEIAQRMAHEIKNPLTPIKLSAQRILRKWKSSPESMDKVVEPAVESIVREVDNLNRLLQEFRDFARLPSPHAETLNISKIIKEVLPIYSQGHKNIAVDLSGLSDIMEIVGDKQQITRVFANVINNAFDAMTDNGSLRFYSEKIHKGSKTFCRIRMEDTGVGIPQDVLANIFTPYYTNKEQGTGLGLAIVERIIFDHNGQIWVESEEGVGTTVFIDLPSGE